MDFQAIATAAKAAVLKYEVNSNGLDCRAALGELATVFSENKGERKLRTASEQNLFTAVVNVLHRFDLGYMAYMREEIATLSQELNYFPAALYGPRPQSRPVDDLDIGPTVTVSEWAANNPPLAEAAARVISLFYDENSADKFKEAVDQVRNAILSDENFAEEVFQEPLLVGAAQAFLQAYKASKMLNEPLGPAIEALSKALTPISDPQDAVPYLYILMRNDLASMNPGKAVAQGSHAANQMIFDATIKTDPLAQFLKPEAAAALEVLVREWSREARGFGTCIVLGVTEKQMRSTIMDAEAAGLHAALTHDPSYPLRDGSSMHLIPLDTCGYVFARKGVARPFVGQFSLMA